MVPSGWEGMFSRMPAFIFLSASSPPVNPTPGSQLGVSSNLSYVQLKSPALQFEAFLFSVASVQVGSGNNVIMEALHPFKIHVLKA